MAVTSQWEWASINRSRDYTRIIGGNQVYRENWSLIRKRISNDEYKNSAGTTIGTGDLGNTSATLSAYNGGEIETISPPSFSSWSFGTTRAYCTSGVTWYKTGYLRNNLAVYLQTEPYKGDLTKSVVLAYVAGDRYYMFPCTPAQADGNTFPESGAVAKRNSASTAVAGTWTDNDGLNSSTLSLASTADPFICTSDIQSYDQSGVNWYTQQQTWISKSPWGN